MATEIKAVVFWVMATQYLVSGYQYLMECWWTVQQQSTAIYIWNVIVKIRLWSLCSCLFEKCEYNNPQFKKWRYSLKVYHEIEISNKCPFPTIVHAIIRDTVTSKHTYIYTGCPRRNVPDFGGVFLMLKYTDITQSTYIQSWTVTEIMAREVWNFDSCYTLTDYQIHIKTGRNMWFL